MCLSYYLKKKEKKGKTIDAGIIHILTYIFKFPLSHAVVQALQNAEVHNYYGLEMAGWDKINWVYELEFMTKQDAVALRTINAHGLYLTSIGDNDKAMDPIQWDIINALNDGRKNNCESFLANEVVFKLISFRMTFLLFKLAVPTSKLSLLLN